MKDPREFDSQYMHVDEISKFVEVSAMINRSNRAAYVSTSFRLLCGAFLTLLIVGMFLHTNAWYVAWTMIAITAMVSTYMWIAHSRSEKKARQADEAFNRWSIARYGTDQSMAQKS